MPGTARRTAHALFFGFAALAAVAVHADAGGAPSVPKAHLISAKALAAQLKGPAAHRPLLLQVGFRMLYAQAHIPGSVYAGPAGDGDGLARLAALLKGVPKTRALILYCGCCPWNKCPNVAAAFRKAEALGFKNVRVLHIPKNFGADWVHKGYPTAVSR